MFHIYNGNYIMSLMALCEMGSVNSTESNHRNNWRNNDSNDNNINNYDDDDKDDEFDSTIRSRTCPAGSLHSYLYTDRSIHHCGDSATWWSH